MGKTALLDTSFLIRLLNDEDTLHQYAYNFFKGFLEEGITMQISTIAIAEYCVRGKIEQLPLARALPLPFTVSHAKRAGELARIVFDKKKVQACDIAQRNIIPNDTKMFAQADMMPGESYFVSADSEARKVYEMINSVEKVNFDFIDIRNQSCNNALGLLDLK